ncbi:MAG: hypothetical protein EA383_11560 [Spirochaetaceae bacterium]|nr:MAG: hypothetical protein EA383_11560 [Spirochaetaceae bacterium]
MSDQTYAIEPSSGPTIRQPSEDDVRSIVERVGQDLEHCILTIPGGDILQTTGEYGKLWFQYADATGMYTCTADSMPNAEVARVFDEALRGDFSWKQRYSFEREELPETAEAEGERTPGSGESAFGGFTGAGGMFAAVGMGSMARRAARGRMGRGGVRIGPNGIRVGRGFGRRRYGRRSGMLGIVLSLVHMFMRRRR